MLLLVMEASGLTNLQVRCLSMTKLQAVGTKLDLNEAWLTEPRRRVRLSLELVGTTLLIQLSKFGMALLGLALNIKSLPSNTWQPKTETTFPRSRKPHVKVRVLTHDQNVEVRKN